MTSDPLIQLGKTIKKKRERAKLSLRELAKKANMSEKRLLNIEHGETNLLLGTIINIASALQMEAYELVKEAEYIKDMHV